MRRRRRMSASARATARCWTLSSLHGAELLGALAVAIAAGCPPPLLQPAATNPSTATASARAAVAGDESPAAGKGNPDNLTELRGSPLPERPFFDARGRVRADERISAPKERRSRTPHSFPCKTAASKNRGRGPSSSWWIPRAGVNQGEGHAPDVAVLLATAIGEADESIAAPKGRDLWTL
jgi:hypothetical protein